MMASGTTSTWQPAPAVGSGWLSQELQAKDRCSLDHRTQRGAETTIVAFPVAFPDGVVYVQAALENASRKLNATIRAAQSLGPDCTLPIKHENVEDFNRANAQLPPDRDVLGLTNAKQATGKAAQLQRVQSSSFRDEVYMDTEGGSCAGGNMLGRFVWSDEQASWVLPFEQQNPVRQRNPVGVTPPSADIRPVSPSTRRRLLTKYFGEDRGGGGAETFVGGVQRAGEALLVTTLCSSAMSGSGGSRRGAWMCEGCGAKRATFGLPHERKKRWCKGCGAGRGAVDVRNKMCEGCGAKRATFGLPHERKRRWCKGCGVGRGAVDVHNKMCEGCGAKYATFGLPHERKKRWCKGCGVGRGAVDVRNKMCEGCGAKQACNLLPKGEHQIVSGTTECPKSGLEAPFCSDHAKGSTKVASQRQPLSPLDHRLREENVQEEQRQWQRLLVFLETRGKFEKHRASSRKRKLVQLYNPTIEASRPQLLRQTKVSTETTSAPMVCRPASTGQAPRKHISGNFDGLDAQPKYGLPVLATTLAQIKLALV